MDGWSTVSARYVQFMPPRDSKDDTHTLDSWHTKHKFPRKFLSSVAELSRSRLCETKFD